MFDGITFFVSFVVWVVGAALWVATHTRWAGEILWIIAGGILFIATTTRLFLVHVSIYDTS